MGEVHKFISYYVLYPRETKVIYLYLLFYDLCRFSWMNMKYVNMNVNIYECQTGVFLVKEQTNNDNYPGVGGGHI
jgi:hypothetical protein